MEQLIKNLAKAISEKIVKDCKAHNDKMFAALYKAFNTFQEDENNGADGIFDLREKNDFALLVDLLGVDKAVNMYNFCKEQGVWYAVYGECHEAPQIVTDIWDFIAGWASGIAACVVAYPYVEDYQTLYTCYVTDTILYDLDKNSTNITCYI